MYTKIFTFYSRYSSCGYAVVPRPPLRMHKCYSVIKKHCTLYRIHRVSMSFFFSSPLSLLFFNFLLVFVVSFFLCYSFFLPFHFLIFKNNIKCYLLSWPLHCRVESLYFFWRLVTTENYYTVPREEQKKLSNNCLIIALWRWSIIFSVAMKNVVTIVLCTCTLWLFDRCLRYTKRIRQGYFE